MIKLNFIFLVKNRDFLNTICNSIIGNINLSIILSLKKMKYTRNMRPISFLEVEL